MLIVYDASARAYDSAPSLNDCLEVGPPLQNQLWKVLLRGRFNDPGWLNDPRKRPENLVTAPSKESNQEVKTTKELFALAVNSDDELDELLARTSYWKTLRVCAWIMQFAQNARTKEASRTKGPLTTEEIEKQNLFWMLHAQSQGTENMEEDRLSLNLQRNKDGLLECRGRLPSPYPIYIPDTTTFAEKLVQHAHKATLHGGVGLTMAKIREEHWIVKKNKINKKKCMKRKSPFYVSLRLKCAVSSFYFLQSRTLCVLDDSEYCGKIRHFKSFLLKSIKYFQLQEAQNVFVR